MGHWAGSQGRGSGSGLRHIVGEGLVKEETEPGGELAQGPGSHQQSCDFAGSWALTSWRLGLPPSDSGEKGHWKWGHRVESACEGEGKCIHVGVPEGGVQVCSLPCALGPSLTNS